MTQPCAASVSGPGHSRTLRPRPGSPRERPARHRVSGGALPGAARAQTLHVHAGSAPADRARAPRAPKGGRGSLTGLRRFSVTFFQSSSCSWCRKPMAGPRSAASAPRPSPLRAPPGPAAGRAARHRPRGGGALKRPGAAARRLRPGGRGYSDSLTRPSPPLKGVSALGEPPGGARARRARARLHLRTALGLAAHWALNAVFPRSLRPPSKAGSRLAPFRGLGGTRTPYASPRRLQICLQLGDLCRGALKVFYCPVWKTEGGLVTIRLTLLARRDRKQGQSLV